MRFITFCQRLLLGSFYTLFLFLPLIFTGDTSELFEFNKMWFTFAVTVIIAAAWFGKMIFEKRITLQRTPLDIPILLFLLSQIIATIFSLDTHISFWGYYSRFNGGLLSTITYIFLYYAFVSNINRRHSIRLLQVSLVSGLLAAFWALPSHFGYDPTCYVFRGTLDVSCWTDAFQPKIRIFGTLGQPDWLAAHLAILIPVAMAFGIHALAKLRSKYNVLSVWYLVSKREGLAFFYYLILSVLFYIDLLYTRARSGVISIWIALFFFFAIILWQERKKIKQAFIPNAFYFILFIGATFFIGTSISQLDKFTFPSLTAPKAQTTAVKAPQAKPAATPQAGEIGGTDSGTIRLFVWRGALDAWMHYPIFGTGVETFAFAYYKFRPAGHNMTSEWDYLYNKAHNEYLNYLTTTGLFGLLTYLGIITYFLFLSLKQATKVFTQHTSQKDTAWYASKDHVTQILTIGLLAGYLSILVSNFFGFSVVTVNLYLFITPAFVFSLMDMLPAQNAIVFPKKSTDTAMNIAPWQYVFILGISLVGLYCIITLFVFWQADKSYAYGMNLDHAGYYQNATPYLLDAVKTRSDEPTFKDELAINEAVTAITLAQKKNDNAGKLAQDAIQLSDEITAQHPNDIVFWKTRVRLFYTLSQANQQYLQNALSAIQKAHDLAPTDAKISYNLGLLYGQTGQPDKAVEALRQTITLKPDYRDAYYALGIMYHQQATDEKGNIINPPLQQKAIDEMRFIQKNFDQHDNQATEALKSWGTE